MKKKLLSFLLCMILVLSFFPTAAFADGGESSSTPSVTIDFTAQAAGAFLCAPAFDVTVAGDIAESYGYTDSITNGVSALDVLVKAHQLIYGEAFTSSSKDNYLVVSSSGYITKLFGIETAANGFALNRGYPNDGTLSSYSCYNGTSVSQTAVSDNDFIEFFAYQDDTSYSDEYSFIDIEGATTKGATVQATVSSISYMYSGYLYNTPELLKAAASAKGGVQLGWINSTTGAVTKIDGAVTDATTKKASITLPSENGTYFLTAFKETGSSSDPYIIMPLKEIVLSDQTAPQYGSCDLTALSVASYDSNPAAETLTPSFAYNVTEYSISELEYKKNSWERMFYVKATAADKNATITASMNGVTQTVTSGDSSWKMLFNCVVPGNNVLTITVVNNSDRKDYIINVPMAYDPATLGTVTFKGLHNAQINSLKLYTYTSGIKGSVDMLANKTTVADGYNLKYDSVSLPAGDYWVEGYDTNTDCNGGIKITIEAGKQQEFTFYRIYAIYASNSGWVKDTDYTLDVAVKSSDGTDRVIQTGTANYLSSINTSCICINGDTVTATFTPDPEKHPDKIAAKKSKTVTTNGNIYTSCPDGVQITFTAPANSIISVGTLSSYYVYSFVEPVSTSSDDSGVTATYKLPKNTDHFYRVQNPNGVTYWNYAKWSTTTNVEITSNDLYIGDSSFNKNTVINDFSKNIYDRADIYLNINGAGYKNMNIGDTFELNSFRNWFAIESYMNAKVALPDMSYQVIDEFGQASDVVTIVPDSKNNNVAVMTAKKEGTAIVLVTYDAMTHMVGQSNTDSKQFSAIWPEFTGVFVVTVNKDGTGITTNMNIDRFDEQTTIDAEHDILFYTGTAGASYSFTPESGCTVTVNRSVVSNKMTFNGFTSTGVNVDSETGEVTVTGLTSGRHIIKVEKGGVANYQVITTRAVSYTILDADGNPLASDATIKAGDTIKIQFSGLVNPKEKLSGAYNYNASLYYKGEDGTMFQSSPGGNYGVYDFSGNPARQIITITIPKYWTEDSYSLSGVIKMGGFSGVPTHRGITYAAGTNPKYDAPSVKMILSELPELNISLAKTDFINCSLKFEDQNGEPISRSALTIKLTDANGNVLSVTESGGFSAFAEEYNYIISGAGIEYKTGSFTVSTDGNNNFTITLQATDANTWDGITTTEPNKDGDVYLIGTGAEFAWFSAQNQANKSNISGKLTANINLGKYPLNNTLKNSSYATVLDGDGYEIININSTSGLFGALGNNSKISNLTLRGNSGNGSIATYANGSNVVIENCVNYSNVSGTTNVGGFVGYAYKDVTIKNCVNHGKISGTSEIGGIIGKISSSTNTITDCYNTGDITASSKNAGGIIGSTDTNIANITNCYNTGTVKAALNAGGIAGFVAGKSTISNCYNVGVITVSDADGAVGSIAGSVDLTTAKIINCYYLSTLAITSGATALSEDDMKSADLGSGYKLVCNSYPVLTWQTGFSEHTPKDSGSVTSPTCGHKGYTVIHCTSCGKDYKTNYVAALEHEALANTEQVFPAYKTYTCKHCNHSFKIWNDPRLEHMELPEANASNISMTDTGDYPWIYNVNDSRFTSSNKGVKGSSTSTITFTLTNGGKLSFNYGVSSRPSFDKLTIKLIPANGDEVIIANNISGINSGSYSSMLNAGTYTLNFTFTKSYAYAQNSDLGYFDSLVLKAYTADEAAQAAIDKTKADAVIALIDAIGTVSLDSENAIVSARNAYIYLSPTQRSMVNNYDVLKAAEAELARLKEAQSGGDGKINVTFRLIGSTLSYSEVDLSSGLDGFHGAKYQTWIATTSYTLDEGSTVYDLFTKALDEAGLVYEGADENYVSTIYAPEVLGGYKLSEFTNGPKSGWMYTVNGTHANVGLLFKELNDNDVVVWHYINDYEYESEDWFYGSLGDETTWNLWLEAEDRNPKAPSVNIPSTTGNAKNVIELIDAIGTVTDKSGDVIKAAREAYDNLSDAQKSLVSNYDVLVAAEAAFAKFNAELPYTDISGHWALEAIKYVHKSSIMNGVGDNRFAPDDMLSRAMLVTMLYRLENEPEVTTTSKFSDINNNEWYTNAVIWASENGIVNGISETEFAPDDDITREQFAAMLFRYAQYKKYDVNIGESTNILSYSDANDISKYAIPVIQWACGSGIIQGRTESTIAPAGTATRAEAATMLMRFCENVAK